MRELELCKKEAKFDAEAKFVNNQQEMVGHIVKLDVGGRRFKTTLTTLCSEESMLSAMFSGRHELGRSILFFCLRFFVPNLVPQETDEEGFIFLDRNGDLFADILEWLRTKAFPQSANWESFLLEAKFYGIQSLVKAIEGRAGVHEQQVSFEVQDLIFKLTHGGRTFSFGPITRIASYMHELLTVNFRAGMFKMNKPIDGVIVVSFPL